MLKLIKGGIGAFALDILIAISRVNKGSLDSRQEEVYKN
jgi:hypothetical protein